MLLASEAQQPISRLPASKSRRNVLGKAEYGVVTEAGSLVLVARRSRLSFGHANFGRRRGRVLGLDLDTRGDHAAQKAEQRQSAEAPVVRLQVLLRPAHDVGTANATQVTDGVDQRDRAGGRG